MNPQERLPWLIHYLLRETGERFAVPEGYAEQFRLFRALVNMRKPRPVLNEFLEVQDAFLQGEIRDKGITTLPPAPIILWRGDITTLCVDGIVNAANSGLMGCFHPNHGCIDNAIHTYTGVQLRHECAEIMRKQGFSEPVGQAKITTAYNLPAKYVLHTVGPMIHDVLSDAHRRALSDCYLACLNLAQEHALTSLAFCCISTGEFRFPPEEAAQIATSTVRAWQSRHAEYPLSVIFNVFKESDYAIYQRLLN